MNTSPSRWATPIAAAALCLAAQATAAVVVNVPGTSDPWLAGMPNGATASSGDVAPTQSPVLVTGLTISGGTTLQWSASGQVEHPGDPAGPDGAVGVVTSHAAGAENGISDITAPIDALLGVFLGPGQPDLNPAPGALDFSTPASLDNTSLSPALQQVFFMGDGLTSGNAVQTVVAPAGATRLFLGTMDRWQWSNNLGAFEVTIIPEPRHIAIAAGLCLLGLGVWQRMHR